MHVLEHELDRLYDKSYMKHLEEQLRDARRRANQNLATVWVVAGLNFTIWLVYLIVGSFRSH